MRYIGEYNPELMYMPGDVVSFMGSSFITIRPAKGVSPIEPGWNLVAARGSNGSNGLDGRHGDCGSTGAGVPVGGVTNQVLMKASENNHDTEWQTITPRSISAADRQHQHQQSDIVGLEAALESKAPASHRHRTDQIDGFQEAINSRAASQHQHLATEIVAGHMVMQSVSGTALIAGSTMVSSGRISHEGELAIAVNGVDRITLSDDFARFNGSVHAGSIKVNIGAAPESSTSAGQSGQIVVTSSHIYVCVSSNTWKRVALEAW
jgi:hypothetical protein